MRKRRTSIKTNAGKITTRTFDYGDAKGIEKLLNGLIAVVFEVSEKGETCVLVATNNGIKRIKNGGVKL